MNSEKPEGAKVPLERLVGRYKISDARIDSLTKRAVAAARELGLNDPVARLLHDLIDVLERQDPDANAANEYWERDVIGRHPNNLHGRHWWCEGTWIYPGQQVCVVEEIRPPSLPPNAELSRPAAASGGQE